MLHTDTGLTLQTSGNPSGTATAHPRFFSGFVTTPEPAALGLLAVAEVARTRYYQPIRPGSLDPVVTGSRDRLRFESFSGCCGVYARLDILPAGMDGEMLEHGTTNVDVNPALRQALARVAGLDPLRFDVGADELIVSTMDGALVEKKVPLPSRWLRGFAEVQVISSSFDPRFEVPGGEAAAFLRRLPRGSDRSLLWVVPAGRGLRLTSRPGPGAVCLPGPGRLSALRPLLRFAHTLRAYGPPATPATASAPSAWELALPTLRLTLTLSPEPVRGFSGEGAVLFSLAGDEVIDDADLVGTLLAWDPTVDVDALATASGLPATRVRAALTQLGTSGRVGYDVADAGYFHRVLPYNADAAARLNPRLVAARRLVAEAAVSLDATTAAAQASHAWVTSGDARYQVRVVAGRPVSCTCQWWASYRGERGPCKHVLAVMLSLAPDDDAEPGDDAEPVAADQARGGAGR
jgi:SWIM zinc finger